MLNLQATGIFATDPTDPRNHFNARMLHEARIASEYREEATDGQMHEQGGLIARLRAALGGRGPTRATQDCACPA